jgi:hypothetical protein
MAISTQHKVYIPDTAKDNQYILAELQLSEDFFASYADTQSCYQQLSQQFFQLADAAGLRNVHFIANDKMPVVRFHTEAFHFQTADQMLFFYNPAYHEARHSYFDPNYRARKISLLCLATGTEIRNQAAEFHRAVKSMLQDFKALLPLAVPLKIRDHQHLSYDLFARAKGCDSSFGYKLRSISARYQARDLNIPADHQAMTYAAVSLPLSQQLVKQLQPTAQNAPYTELYQQLEQKLVSAATSQQLTRLALVADGSTPLVRSSQLDKPKRSQELHMLSFDLTSPNAQVFSYWQADQRVETAFLLLVAGQDDNTEFGYGRFMNQVEQALKTLAQQLNLDPAKDDLIVRFHQHISYQL